MVAVETAVAPVRPCQGFLRPSILTDGFLRGAKVSRLPVLEPCGLPERMGMWREKPRCRSRIGAGIRKMPWQSGSFAGLFAGLLIPRR